MPKLSKRKLDSFVEIQEIFNIKNLFDLDTVKVSEGVMYVATEGEALWLIGSIANLQAKIKEDFQIWRVIVHKNLSAELSCRNRHGKICLSLPIDEVIDFGLSEIELCVAKPYGIGDFMIMLPREANNYYGDKIAPLAERSML